MCLLKGFDSSCSSPCCAPAQVGLGLWLGSVPGRALDDITLLLLLHLGAFSSPLLYHKNKARIKSTVADVMSLIKVR